MAGQRGGAPTLSNMSQRYHRSLDLPQLQAIVLSELVGIFSSGGSLDCVGSFVPGTTISLHRGVRHDYQRESSC